MDIDIRLTEEGSHTLYSPDFQAFYHSTHGAIQETRHVFIEAGLLYGAAKKEQQQLSILEIGFGTGLNAFMTYLQAQKLPLSIYYDSLEAYPIGPEKAALLNYPQMLNAETLRDSFLRLHRESKLKLLTLEQFFFDFQLIITKFEDFEAIKKYDLIYFDAFAPSVQAHLWQEPFLAKMYELLGQNGVLVSYCAQGTFKRALKNVGFQIENLPGPKGKREMTRAIKK